MIPGTVVKNVHRYNDDFVLVANFKIVIDRNSNVVDASRPSLEWYHPDSVFVVLSKFVARNTYGYGTNVFMVLLTPAGSVVTDLVADYVKV